MHLVHGTANELRDLNVVIRPPNVFPNVAQSLPTTAAAMHEALVDLADRWRRARDAALRALVPAHTEPESLLATALARAPDEAQRRVFDNSLRLGRGFARTFGVALSLEQLRDSFPHLGVPCLHGTLRDIDAAFYLERNGCANEALGPAACDFMREAINGLVLGITGDVRHARHESRGRGGERCVDLLHEDPESALRFGPIPEATREVLASVTRTARAFDSASEVTFLGISENVLTYRIDRRTGPGEVNVRTLVERSVRRKLPGLSLREISPRPVIDGDA